MSPLLSTDSKYKNEQPRTNSGAPLYFKLKFNSILFTGFQLKCTAAVQFDEHILDNGYLSTAKAKYDPETNSVSVSSVNFNSGVNFKMLTIKGTGDDKVVATNPGDTVNVTGTVTLTMGDKTQDFPISATVQINKFPVTSSGISLMGLNAAVYPAPTPSRNLLTATSKAASLEDMPGNTFDFDSIFSPSNGFKNSGLGAAITNQNTDRIWTCVGFIPCTKSIEYANDVKEFVLDEDETEAASEGFTLGTLEDARQYVADHFGVLYGAEATDENLQAMVDHGLVSGTSGKLAIVWYVAKPPGVQAQRVRRPHHPLRHCRLSAHQPGREHPARPGRRLRCGRQAPHLQGCADRHHRQHRPRQDQHQPEPGPGRTDG